MPLNPRIYKGKIFDPTQPVQKKSNDSTNLKSSLTSLLNILARLLFYVIGKQNSDASRAIKIWSKTEEKYVIFDEIYMSVQGFLHLHTATVH